MAGAKHWERQPSRVFEDVELGSGVRPFPAGQHSGAGRVVGQSAGGQQAGQLGHLRAVAVPALSFHCRF